MKMPLKTWSWKDNLCSKCISSLVMKNDHENEMANWGGGKGEEQTEVSMSM
jgi:hypothetical protein